MSSGTQVLTYRYRVLPTKGQHRALESILEDQRQLYNAALEERIEFYRKTGRTKGLFDQIRSLPECRTAVPEMATVSSLIQQGTLRRLDLAYSGFFRRVKNGASVPGFPRFRSKRGFKSFAFSAAKGFQLRGGRILFKGMPGRLRLNWHRHMPDSTTILSCYFKQDHKGWIVGFLVRNAVQPVSGWTARDQVGIDLGLRCLATTSHGSTIENIQAGRLNASALRKVQRAFSRCKKGSNGRLKALRTLRRAYAKVVNSRHTHLHAESSRLVARHSLVAVESLNVGGLMKGNLSKSINDVSWRTFVNFLRYKAERAGVQLIEVDARFTSQTCPECGVIKAKTLDERVHDCPCGCVLDRDVAAARVILNKAIAGLGAHNVTHRGERGLRNLGANAETLSKRWNGRNSSRNGIPTATGAE